MRNARLRYVVLEDSLRAPQFEQCRHERGTRPSQGTKSMEGLLEVALFDRRIPNRRSANFTALTHKQIASSQSIPLQIAMRHRHKLKFSDVNLSPSNCLVSDVGLWDAR